MTDRELLELAAKAAGIKGLQFESDGTIQNRANRPTIPYECHGLLAAIDWNPLKDDGDALRLAVKLHLFIDATLPEVKVGWVVDCQSGLCEDLHEEQSADPYAATRRAIVRAAAEIGKGME